MPECKTTIDDVIGWLDKKIETFDFILETDASPSKEDFKENVMLATIRDFLIHIQYAKNHCRKCGRAVQAFPNNEQLCGPCDTTL